MVSFTWQPAVAIPVPFPSLHAFKEHCKARRAGARAFYSCPKLALTGQKRVPFSWSLRNPDSPTHFPFFRTWNPSTGPSLENMCFFAVDVLSIKRTSVSHHVAFNKGQTRFFFLSEVRGKRPLGNSCDLANVVCDRSQMKVPFLWIPYFRYVGETCHMTHGACMCALLTVVAMSVSFVRLVLQ